MQETQETQVRSLSWEDPLEKEMATHSSVPAWRIPWTEDPGGLCPRGCKESDTTEWLSTCRSTTWSLSLCKIGCYHKDAYTQTQVTPYPTCGHIPGYTCTNVPEQPRMLTDSNVSVHNMLGPTQMSIHCGLSYILYGEKRSEMLQPARMNRYYNVDLKVSHQRLHKGYPHLYEVQKQGKLNKLFRDRVSEWKSLSHVWLFATPWTIQSMEFSRPEDWSG